MKPPILGFEAWYAQEHGREWVQVPVFDVADALRQFMQAMNAWSEYVAKRLSEE